MKPERFQEIERLYLLAMQLKTGKREAFLKEACAGDELLRKEVENLIGIAESRAMGDAARKLAGASADRTASYVESKSLARYRIMEKIGAGGMGVVYRAHDEHLQRDVAIKVLPPGILGDDSARRRFRREALTLSKLNHPNIETVHDFDQHDGVDLLVMEYIPGITLRARLLKGPLSEKEIASLGLQLAEGLAAAHSQKVVHRDIKPGNLLITPEERLKILDFGLAKMIQPSAPNEFMETVTLSQAILGTVPYMSPEQLRGEPLDERTDIYSAGTVLYEMATGQLPFQGRSASGLADEILHNPPPLPSQFMRDIFPLLEQIVLKCLEKEPSNRYQTARELSVDLRRLSAQVSAPVTEDRGIRLPWITRTKISILGVVAISLGVLLWAIWGGRIFAPREVENAVLRFRPHIMPTGSVWAGKPNLSPDGSKIAYACNQAGNLDIYVIDVNGNSPRQLTNDSALDDDPTWYPDGNTIAFYSERGGKNSVWKVDCQSGNVSPMLEDAGHPAISPDSKWIAFTRTMPDGKQRIGVALLSDPARQRIITHNDDGSGDHVDPAWSPDGKMVCYSSGRDLWVVRVDDGASAKQVTCPNQACTDPSWSSNGRELYFTSFQNGTKALWRAKLGGTPEPISIGAGSENHPTISKDGTKLTFSTSAGAHQLLILDRKSGTVSELSNLHDDNMGTIAPDNSKVVFLSCRGRDNRSLWVQPLRQGKPSGLPYPLNTQAGDSSHPAFSPDGQWVAYYQITNQQRDIYIIPATGGDPVQFTSDPASDIHPAWSKDGRKLAFVSERSGMAQIWIAPVAGGERAGPERMLGTKPLRAFSPAWSADGQRIAFMGGLADDFDVYVVAADGSMPATRLASGATEGMVRWDWSRNEVLASGIWGAETKTICRISVLRGGCQAMSPPLVLGLKTMPSPVFNISSDGNLIVFTREDPKGDVYLLEAVKGKF